MIARDVIITALAELETSRGRLTPSMVVNAARPKKHPLHPAFIWDDAAAAEEHRIDTARRLMAIHVKVVSNGRILHVPLYTRDPEAAAGEQGMVRTMRLKSEPDNARDALVTEMVRVSNMLGRARDLARLLGREKDIVKIEAEVSSFLGSLDSDPTGDDARPTA
jgi:hypothetical protein